MAWLRYHKEKWKLQKRARDERRKLIARQNGVGGALGGGMLSGSGVMGGLGGFLWQQNRALVDLPWQLIQVRIYTCIEYSVCFLGGGNVPPPSFFLPPLGDPPICPSF